MDNTPSTEPRSSSPSPCTSTLSPEDNDPTPAKTSSQSNNYMPTQSEEKEMFHHILSVDTDCPDATNAAQWFYKPYLQPSSISSTATSSLMPSTPTSTPPRTTIDHSAGTVAAAIPNTFLPPRSSHPIPAMFPAIPTPTLPSGPMTRPTNGGDHWYSNTAHPSAIHRTSGPYSSAFARTGPYPLNPQPPAPQQDQVHNNPYRAPSFSNTHAFAPPRLPGYEFTGGSQAGNMGLVMGKRLSDGAPVMAKLHQSRTVLQHECRILKRLQISHGKYDPRGTPPPQFQQTGSDEEEATDSKEDGVSAKSKCQPRPGIKKAVYEKGLVESEKYFNRVVYDFVDLDEEQASVLVLERLGPNILSHHHHRFTGLENLDGNHCPETQDKKSVGSPFPDLYTFLVFCLKAGCVLEALQQAGLAHLAICPTALHWAPPGYSDCLSTKEGQSTPCTLYDDAQTSCDTTSYSSCKAEEQRPYFAPYRCFAQDGSFRPFQDLDVNDTKLRLFDFTHSKILSHERARAPNNIVEWQIPGYLEYHLQFLAPEQTGRAETWMDQRTDIYALGATLFSLLTMQFPYPGNDSVQILQGVLSKDLPPVQDFRPDIPPIVDDILRKMTQKQPSQRYQNAFGFKQDILRCLNLLRKTGTVETFPLGDHDLSYQFILPNAIFGRQAEQQLISTEIVRAAGAYQHTSHTEAMDGLDLAEAATLSAAMVDNSDYYVFENDIVSLQGQHAGKIPLTSKTLLRTPKLFDGGKANCQGAEASDPVVRVIFVSGPSGVGKTVMVRGMATTARNSGLFAGGIFEEGSSAPYSAILSCIQSVLQQLLAQHTEALASLVVAIRTAFEPTSGIGIICDLVPELKYFFHGSDMPESKDVPLTHSVARFHALILKLIRVISTHFFMTWLIDDIHFADENSIALLATLVNVNKRLPIVLIMTHRDTPDCLIKVKQVLGYSSVGGNSRSEMDQDVPMEEISRTGTLANFTSSPSTTRVSAMEGADLPPVVRGGGGVRFIRLQNPTLSTIQDFLVALLHRDKADVISLAEVLHSKSWLTIRQLALELYRNQTIFFNCLGRLWEWEADSQTLAQVVRKLTGEEYAFLESRFRALDCETKKTLICASICGPCFKIQDLQHLVSTSYSWLGAKCPEKQQQEQQQPPPQSSSSSSSVPGDLPGSGSSDQTNTGCSAMAGLQSAIREGILVYTSVPDHLRFHHGVMRRVAVSLLEGTEETEKLHYEMAKILFPQPGQEFRTASHVLQSINLIKKKLASLAMYTARGSETDSQMMEVDSENALSDLDCENESGVELDTRSLRMILSLAGEKSQKSGAQDMALSYWNAALSLLPKDCWAQPVEGFVPPPKTVGAGASVQTPTLSSDSEISQAGSVSNGTLSSASSSTSASSTLSSSMSATLKESIQNILSRQLPLYHEALKLHLQCIEAERWRENFDQAMAICDVVLENVQDPIDRARVYQHQIEMSVWAYSQADRATAITIQCLEELGMPRGSLFTPTEEQTKSVFLETHRLLSENMERLGRLPLRLCTDPRIAMRMEVLTIASGSLYYCNVPFMAMGIAESVRLTVEHGICKDTGRALASFAMTHSTWYGCLENAYELGKLACAVSNGSHHVKFLFYLTVQQWGDHIANSIPALEETLTAVDLACDRLFHTAGMIHICVMKVLLGRLNLKECMTGTVELLGKHVEFGPRSHGVEVMCGIVQMVKCLRGKTRADNPEFMFEDLEDHQQQQQQQQQQQHQAGSEEDPGHDSQHPQQQKQDVEQPMAMVHNNSTYQMLKVVAAFIYGHYGFIEQVTEVWHDDPKSIMNFEGSWIAHSIFTVVGLTLANLLRTTIEAEGGEEDAEMNLENRRRYLKRLKKIWETMRVRAEQYPTNHAAMFYLIEAELLDQDPQLEIEQVIGMNKEDDENQKPVGNRKQRTTDLKEILLRYERALFYANEGDFPLQKCFAFELAAKCHLRHGLVTSGKCLIMNACKGYQTWGAVGKVQALHRQYPTMFPLPPGEVREMGRGTCGVGLTTRGLFHRPGEKKSQQQGFTARCPLQRGTDMTTTVTATGSSTAWACPPTRIGSSHLHSNNNNNNNSGSDGGKAAGSPSWLAASPSATAYSPTGFGSDAVSAAAVAVMADSSCLTSAFHVGGSHGNSGSSGSVIGSTFTSSPVMGHHPWLGSPQSPELDNSDLDVLDFSSVIEAMQVIASEIDLDLLLVKSLGVLNQSVGAKRCCIIISKDQELVLAASLGDLGRCESVNPPREVRGCGPGMLFQSVINYVINTSSPCLLTNAKDDPRFCADEYLTQHRPAAESLNGEGGSGEGTGVSGTGGSGGRGGSLNMGSSGTGADQLTVLCAPILHKAGLVGVLYMEEFPERAFANKRMLVMNLLVQQLGISITNALLYQSVVRSETKLNGLLEIMPCGIALWDAAAENCQYVNSSWAQMTGYTVEEILDCQWRCVLHPEDMLAHGMAWQERVHAGVPCEWHCRYGLKDGTYRWSIVRMLPIYAPPGSDSGPSTTSSTIVTSPTVGIATPPSPASSSADPQPPSPPPQKVIQWLTVTIDIDDQRKAVQLKSNFLANMSHELRTPFSGILGMLSLLRDSSGLSHEQFEFVDMAKASCEMLIRIVDDLLNFSKLEADKVTLEYLPMCFEEVLGDVCDLLVPLASRKGLELIILPDDTLPLLLIGDPDRMKQILINLIGNATKFSTKGNIVIKYWHEVVKREDGTDGSSLSPFAHCSSGEKSVKGKGGQGPAGASAGEGVMTCGNYLQALHDQKKAADMDYVRQLFKGVKNDPKDTLTTAADIISANCSSDGYNGSTTQQATEYLGQDIILHCSVTDQGIGLSPEEQKMLFVSFQQTDNGTTRKYGGTGLGLSICAQLIAHMHGKITVDSEKGQGSTFTFSAKLRAMDIDTLNAIAKDGDGILSSPRVGASNSNGGTGMDVRSTPRGQAPPQRNSNPSATKGSSGASTTTPATHNSIIHFQAAEVARIFECDKVLRGRWKALEGKRILVLSPNRELREQILKTAPLALYSQFDDVASAVQSRAIGIMGSHGIEVLPRGQDGTLGMEMEGVEREQKDALKQEQPPLQPSQALDPFDFILVDHVLDSAELDCIFPSPTVAFVLLLAPTTEILRWILPPAEKKIKKAASKVSSRQSHPPQPLKGVSKQTRVRVAEIRGEMDPESGTASDDVDEDEEEGDVTVEDDEEEEDEEDEEFGMDSNDVDIGGRGRVCIPSEIEFTERAKSQVRGQSLLGAGAAARKNRQQEESMRTEVASVHPLAVAGPSTGSCDSTLSSSSSSSLSTPFHGGISVQGVLVKKPSQLFKRRKTKRVNSGAARGTCTSVRGTEGGESLAGVEKCLSGTGPNSGCAFQVCRMIKPVRRMKLLQILYNAILQKEQDERRGFSFGNGTSSGTGKECMEDGQECVVSELDIQEQAHDDSLDPGLQQKDSASRMPASTKKSGIKRKLKGSHSGGGSHVACRRREMEQRQEYEEDDEEYGEEEESNLRKRARNNDALTLLLTSEERRRCRGVNVLVAEDDFVSQKILEKQLSKLGMNVMIADNGQEAVNRWLAAERGFYTIAIFDHHMPIMDGLAATKRIRELEAGFAEEAKAKLAATAAAASQGDGDENVDSVAMEALEAGVEQMTIRIPIVGLSADIQNSTKESCIVAGMDEYMTKPLLTKGLALLIQRYCCGEPSF